MHTVPTSANFFLSLLFNPQQFSLPALSPSLPGRSSFLSLFKDVTPVLRKNSLSTHNDLPFLFESDNLPRSSLLSLISSFLAHEKVQPEPADALLHPETALPLCSLSMTHIPVFSMLYHPPLRLPTLSLRTKPRFLIAISLPATIPFASAARGSFCQPAFSTQPT